MALSGAQITRLGASGTPKMLYASFAGKTEAVDLGPPVGTLLMMGYGR